MKYPAIFDSDNRLIDLKHTTRIDRIEDAMKALGRELKLSVA